MNAKTGRIKRDRQERFNLKRAWFVVAWRIVDEHGRDMIQPWCRKKREALETARAVGIEIVGEDE